MKSFKTFLLESVPNRSHGRVFRLFYDMGREGKLADFDVPIKGQQRIGSLQAMLFGRDNRDVVNQMDLPAHSMKFPSFKDDRKGRRRSIRVSTIPAPLPGTVAGSSKGIATNISNSTNIMDLRKISGTDNIASVIGHEAFHSAQNARMRSGDTTYGGRKYTDAIGNVRTTSDASYADNIDRDSHNKELVQNLEKMQILRGMQSPFSKEQIDDAEKKLSRAIYMRKDDEHDARLGGAIAYAGHSVGSNHQRYGFLRKGHLMSFDEFLDRVRPTTRRQLGKTKKAYGRMATEFRKLVRSQK